MARFNWQRLAPETPPARIAALLNERMLGLANFLQGLRREGTRLIVEKGDAETEEAGTGLIVKTPDGTKRYRISISNAGGVTATLL